METETLTQRLHRLAHDATDKSVAAKLERAAKDLESYEDFNSQIP